MGIFGGKNKKKCEECIARGRRMLTEKRYDEAGLTLTEVIADLDPDNKTGLHVRARYLFALSRLFGTFDRYCNRNTERGIARGEAEEHIQSLGKLVAGSNSDEWLLISSKLAIKHFTATLDLKPISYDIDAVRGMEFEVIRIAMVPDWVINVITKEEQWEFYSLEPLDIHCGYGIRNAEALIRKIYREHHHKQDPEFFHRVDQYGLGPACRWAGNKNGCSVCKEKKKLGY